MDDNPFDGYAFEVDFSIAASDTYIGACFSGTNDDDELLCMCISETMSLCKAADIAAGTGTKSTLTAS